MAKDPAFLFYPNDWLGGTLGMTFEEKGAYMELLMLQFNRGHMSGHMIGQTIGQLWVKIQDKFTQDDKGLYYNPRLEQEINNRKSYVNSRRNNILGHNQYSKEDKKTVGHMDGHKTSHMEDEDINVNINKGGVGGIFQKPTISEVKEYCIQRGNSVDANKWFDFYESKGWMVGRNRMKDWKAAVRTWEKDDNKVPVLRITTAKDAI